MTFTPQNKRSREMWEQIIRHVDFKDKSVIDVGCGYGDFCFYAWMEGAQVVVGTDEDSMTIRHCVNTYQGFDLIDQPLPTGELYFTLEDVEEWDVEWNDKWDVGMCFSVLPYIEDPYNLLYALYEHCTIILLEVQYYGDGPGKVGIKNDDDMSKILGIIGWDTIKKIGSTTVKGRNKKRTIWLCQKLI